MICTDALSNARQLPYADGKSQDTFFDLVPSEVKIVRFLERHRASSVRAKPHFSEYVTDIEMQRL